MKAQEFIEILSNISVGYLQYYPHLGNIALQIILNPVEDMPIRLAVFNRMKVESGDWGEPGKPIDVLMMAKQIRRTIKQMGGAA